METSNCCRTFPEPELLSPHGTGGAHLLCGDDTGDTPFFLITLLREFPELVQSWLLTEFCEELNEDDHELKENLIKKKWNVQKNIFPSYFSDWLVAPIALSTDLLSISPIVDFFMLNIKKWKYY